MEERIVVFYKENKLGQTVTKPFKIKQEAINYANNLFKNGYFSVRVSKIKEQILFEPSSNF